MTLALRLRLVAVVGILVGLLAGMNLVVAPPYLAQAQGSNTIDLSLRALGYNDQVVMGRSPSFDVVFPDPGSPPGDSQLVLSYSHAEILLPEFSLVSVLVNTIPVYSTRLDGMNVKRTSVTINIPADRFQAGPNRISFRFELRLREECDGDNSPARNAIIYSDTTLRYGPPANPSPPDLRDFPGQFTFQTRPNTVIGNRPTAIKGQPTIAVPLGVAIPPDATPAERNGAGTLLLALGASHATLPVEPVAITTNDVVNASRNENVVLIGRASSVAPELLRGTPFGIMNGAWQRVDNLPIPGDAGVLLMATPPDAPRGRIFIVSGNNDTGVNKAIAILKTGNTANLLTGQGAVITDVTPTPPVTLAPTKYTLQDLGITGDAATVTGLGMHSIPGSFIVPGSITQAATIQIDFAGAPTLEPRLSTMTALINDQPFITQPLDGKNGERRLLTAQVPPSLFRPGLNVLRFTFALQGQGAGTCGAELPGPAEFATLFPGTNLTLPVPARDLTNLSLGLYPFPFATDNDPMTVIINDPRDAGSLSAAYRLMLDTGSVAQRGATARLLAAPEATPQALRGLNAAVIGFPGGNPVLDPIMDQLFFVAGNGELRLRDTGAMQRVAGITPVASPAVTGSATVATTGGTTGSGAPAPGSAAQFAGGGTGPVGVLQILPAPWDNTRFMLVIAGSTPDLRALATDALTLGRFTGREAVISRDMQGQLVVGEARAVSQLAPVPPAVSTVPAPGGATLATLPAGGASLPSTRGADSTPLASTSAASGTALTPTQAVGTPGVGTMVPGASATSGNSALRTPAIAGSAAPANNQIFGLPRTAVFGIIAAVVLAIGILVIALFVRGQRRAE